MHWLRGAGERNNPMKIQKIALVVIAAAATLVWANMGFAHCDGLDGPVVKAAQRALDSGEINYVLIWVTQSDEAEIKRLFEKTLAVRQLNAQAKELADLYFFETLVRIHRASEGAPYTGLKPAGRDLGPAITAADRALETRSLRELLSIITETVTEGVTDRFKEVVAKDNFSSDDIEGGRRYVKAYVEFLDYVETLYETAGTREETLHPEP
jgi:uncharacterized protein DUF6448